MNFENVTLDPQANIYFDGKCVSHTFFTSEGARLSAGVIFPASLNFGTAAPEVMELNAGACRVRMAGSDDWNDYAAGDSFSVPGDSSFDIEVTETLGYVCRYG